MARWAFRLSLALAAVLAAAGGWLALRPARLDDPPFTFDPAHDLGRLTIGDHQLEIPITNPAGVPRRVVGLAEWCNDKCCVKSRYHEPITVGPGETFAYGYTLDVRAEGPFESGITLYLEDNGIREIEIVVRGVGVAPAEEPAHAPPPTGP